MFHPQNTAAAFALVVLFFSSTDSLFSAEVVEQQRVTSDEHQSLPELSGQIAFWDFQEDAGSPRQSGDLALVEQRGPIKRVNDGIFGDYSAELKRGQWLSIPRSKLGPLNIHGPDAEVTVVAWIKRGSTDSWQAIAGVWGETRKKRQYCLFVDGAKAAYIEEDGQLVRHPIRNRVHGHVSAVGGPTPGRKFCNTYSTGATVIPQNQWVCIAMRYDGKFSSVFVNGELDSLPRANPFVYDKGLFDGGDDGEAFTVGAVDRSNEWGNFFGGRIAGLAVYDRALTDKELKRLATETGFEKDRLK
ncbi:MAG: LamG domain-containing protein [bacterium]|nr:LamG domain-containing protein [bacterium]